MNAPQKKRPIDDVPSQVRVRLLDPLGRSIEGLKYQIREGDKIIAKGITDAQGSISSFVSKIGAELSLQVERFGREEMKTIRTLMPWAEDYSVKLVSSKVKHTVVAKKDKGSPGDYKRKTYIVKPGDTLGKIAARCQSTPHAVARLNGIKVTDTIYPDQVLKLPLAASGTGPGPAPAVPGTPAPTTRPPIAASASAAPGPGPAAPTPVVPSPEPEPVADAEPALGADGKELTAEDTPPTVPEIDVPPAKVSPIAPPAPVKVEQSTGVNGTPKTTVDLKCDGNACLKLGSTGRLVEEVNIRLAGFGGTILAGRPWSEFTTATEKAVSQFQKDFMKVTPTGKVCRNVLQAIDKFAAKYPFDITNMKCPCHQCGGFGTGKTQSSQASHYLPKSKSKAGKEFPGMHRAILAWLRTVSFYCNLESELGYSFLHISSGYRCWIDNKKHSRFSCNHMGQALDLQFQKNKSGVRVLNSHINKIRSDIIIKHGLGRLGWSLPGTNKFCMETTAQGATTWVHIDCRTFSPMYMADRFFSKTQGSADGEPMLHVAKAEGHLSLLSCGGILPAGEMPVVAPPLSTAPAGPKAPSARPKAAASAAGPAASPGDATREPIGGLTPSAKLIEFIHGFEKFEGMPYDDAKNYCTIGWGHLVDGLNSCAALAKKGSKNYLKLKGGVTRAQGDAIFADDLQVSVDIVKSVIRGSFYQHEFDAMVALAFNTGGNFFKFKNLIARANSRDYSGCCAEFADITSGGLAGLVLRRKREMAMFTHATYNSKH